MGRHSQRKYGNSLAVNNSRIIRSHTHKAHIHGNGDLPYGVGHTRQYRFQNQGLGLNSRRGVAPIGLLGLAALGFIGYKFMSRKSVGGFGMKRSWLPWGKTSALPIGGLGGVSSLKSNLATGFTNTTGIVPTAGVSRVSPTMKERMGFTGKYPKVGIMGAIKGIKNKALYGTKYMIKEPVYPVNTFNQVL